MSNINAALKKGCSVALCAGVLFGSTSVNGSSLSAAVKIGASVVGSALGLGATYGGARYYVSRTLFPGAFKNEGDSLHSFSDKNSTYNIDGVDRVLERKKVIFSNGESPTYRGFTFKCADPASKELSGKCIVLYGGNDGSVAFDTSEDLLMKFANMGATILAVDYRGFGKNDLAWPKSLRISERAVYKDGEEIYNYAKETLGYSNEDIIVFGYSLGGAVASHVMSYASGREEKLGGAVLASPIDSFKNRARKRVGAPLAAASRLVTWAKLDTLANLSGVKTKHKDIPMLFVSGDENDWLSLESTFLDKKATEDLKFKNVIAHIAPACGHSEIVKMFNNETEETALKKYINFFAEDKAKDKTKS